MISIRIKKEVIYDNKKHGREGGERNEGRRRMRRSVIMLSRGKGITQ